MGTQVSTSFLPPLVARNKIINGDLTIWQRGNTVSTVDNSNKYFAADRFYGTVASAGGVYSLSKSAIGSSNSVKLTVVTAAPGPFTGVNRWHGICQSIEAQTIYDLNGKSVTISFDFKANFTGTLSLSLSNAGALSSYVTSFSFVANTATKVVKTIALPAGLILTNDNALGATLCIGFYNTDVLATATSDTWLALNKASLLGTTNYTSTIGNVFEMANVQLEEGTAVTAFEHIGPQNQITLCERYYQQAYNGSYRRYVGNVDRTQIPLRTTMRASPTIYSSWTVGSGYQSSTLSAQPNFYEMDYQFTSGTTGVVDLFNVVIWLEAEL
jgi:hypothetical protein